MSSFYRRTKNPATGAFDDAMWIDDYFGRHRYGVQFPDGKVYRQSERDWEFEDVPVQHPVTGETWVLDGKTGRTKEVIPGPAEHVQLGSLRRVLGELEGLRGAAESNGEEPLANFLQAACIVVEMAIGEARRKPYRGGE